MHLLIPHASALDDAFRRALADTPLPHLDQLLSWMTADGSPLGGDEYALNTSQDLALAATWGWQGDGGGLPFAAQLAQRDGVAVGALPWALVTPLHLSVGSDQVTVLPPEHLQLDEAASRACFDALAELWPATEGWQWVYGSRHQWYLGHEALAGLHTASLDRIVLRNVDAWMPESRLLRRLQNEVQMLLHRHPVTAAREAQGHLPVNSVWFSGCGPIQPCQPADDLQIDERLRSPLLQGDSAAWRQAWQALDAGPLSDMLRRIRDGRTDDRLTLCGERWAQTYRCPPRSGLARWWQGWRRPRTPAASVLEGL